MDPLAEPALDAVKVMTHHGAKGLEWPVVILTDLQAPVRSRLWSITASSRSMIDVGNPLKDRFIRYWPWPFGKQGSVPVADEIDQTDVAVRLHTSAVAEGKRLLYVSMTRARDLLILARSRRSPTGEWLETVDAPWLLPTSPADALTLPSGETIDALHSALDPIGQSEATTTAGQPLFWFCDPATLSTKLPLVFNPSAATSPDCKVLEPVPMGQRIALATGTDMAQLGTAIHACVAGSFTDPGAPLSLDELDLTLNGMGVGDRVAAASVLGNIETLHQWIGTRWPGHRAFAEVPVEARLASGQILQGRIDLLLELDDRWVLFDHKSNPQGHAQWESVAQLLPASLRRLGMRSNSAPENPFPSAGCSFRCLPGRLGSRSERWMGRLDSPTVQHRPLGTRCTSAEPHILIITLFVAISRVRRNLSMSSHYHLTDGPDHDCAPNQVPGRPRGLRSRALVSIFLHARVSL